MGFIGGVRPRPEVMDTKSGLWYRQLTYDLSVIREQTVYRIMPLTAQDVVLDLGANIGAFACRYGPGVKQVICYEPEPDNFQLLLKNTAHLENAIKLNVAVMDDKATPRITLYRNDQANKGAHSVVPTRGRTEIEVPCLPLSRVYAAWNPTAVKCDIEGAEYRSILTTPTPDCVRRIVMELHLTKPGFRKNANALVTKLYDEGFSIGRSPRITETNWHTLGYFTREAT